MSRPRSYEDAVATTFSEYVGHMLLDTPDEVILKTWHAYPLHDLEPRVR